MLVLSANAQQMKSYWCITIETFKLGQEKPPCTATGVMATLTQLRGNDPRQCLGAECWVLGQTLVSVTRSPDPAPD